MKPYRLQDDPGMLDEHGLVNLEFGDELPQVKVLPERIKQMYRMYDQHPGEHCKTCIHLIRHQPGQKYFLKCDLNKITSGPGTDWRAGWGACGKWEKKK